ncbi:MAG: hypothetical protein K2X27_26675 [Candidatus Obscuribacterales bacterium]|nr:hypothetical protein [Candidatus Obscuribacterales bacterium]
MDENNEKKPEAENNESAKPDSPDFGPQFDAPPANQQSQNNQAESKTASEKGSTVAGGDNSAGAVGDAKSKGSIFSNPLGLLNDYGSVVSKGLEDSYKAAAETLPNLDIVDLADKLSKSSDPLIAARAKNDAEALKASANSDELVQNQLDKYFDLRDKGKPEGALAEKKEAGEYKNEDGSSYVVDKNGDITSLTTKASEAHPQGETYKASYNDKHELIKLEYPTGKSFTRTSPENDRGFAYWQARDSSGKAVSYGNAGAQPFVGKLSLDSAGSHIMIGHDKQNPAQNTKWAGSVIDQNSDGSMLRSSLISEKGKTTGFKSEIENPDGTKVEITSKLVDGKVVLDDKATVKSKSGDQISTVSDGKVIDRKEHLLADAKMAELARGLDSSPKLQNLRHADIRSRGESLHVAIDNYAPSTNRAVQPGTVINGIMPDRTEVSNHLEFDLSHGKDNSVRMSNISGMEGHGFGLGPLKRRWHEGSSPVMEVRMAPGQDGKGVMQSLSSRGWMAVHSDYLNENARNSVSKSGLEKTSMMSDLIKDSSKHTVIDHPYRREFRMQMEPTAKLKENLSENGVPVELKDKVAAKMNYSENAIKVSEIKGVNSMGKELSALSIEPSADGKFKASIDLIDPKTKEKHSVTLPDSQVAPLLDMLSQFSAAKDKAASAPKQQYVPAQQMQPQYSGRRRR